MRLLSEIIEIKDQKKFEYVNSYTCKYSKKKNILYIFQVTIPTKVQEDLSEKLQKQITDKKLEHYDPEQESQDTVYEFKGKQLPQHFAITNTFYNSELKEDNNALTEFEIKNSEDLPPSDKIDFYIHEYLFEGKKVLIFSKQVNSKITKKTFFELNGSEFKEIDNKKLYLFSNDITCLLYEENYYIFNIKNFHGIFKYWEELIKIRDEIIIDLEKENIISNFSDYKEEYSKFYNITTLLKLQHYKGGMQKYIKDHTQQLSDICTNNNNVGLKFDSKKQQFEILDKAGVTVLNRILSDRSGHNLNSEFITFPSFKKHNK